MENVHFLTEDQYDTLFLQAHNLCTSCRGKYEICGYTYLDKLLNYTTMVTGKYPAPRTILKVWDKARETDGKGGTKDAEMIMEALIGPFTYDKNRVTKPLYELLVEDLKAVLRENDELREKMNIKLEDISTE